MADEISQYLSAALVDYAKDNGRNVSGEIGSFRRQVASYFEWEFDQEKFGLAIDILRKFGIASVTTDVFAGGFVAIDFDEYENFRLGFKSERDKIEELTRNEDYARLKSVKSQSFRVLLIEEFEIFGRYLLFGRDWLIRAVNAIKERSAGQEISARQEEVASHDSELWTGRYAVSEVDRLRVIEYIQKIQRDIDRSDLTNAQKSEALALVKAAESLAESPSPAWEIVERILGSPVLANFTSVVALIVAIIND